MKRRHILFASIAGCLFTVASTYAQWPDVKTPGIPRLADGKPNLSAPPLRTAEGHPDLSGVWDIGNMTYFHDLASGLKPGEAQLTPWAAAIQKQRRDRNHVDDPYGYCLPLGVPRIQAKKTLGAEPAAMSLRLARFPHKANPLTPASNTPAPKRYPKFQATLHLMHSHANSMP